MSRRAIFSPHLHTLWRWKKACLSPADWRTFRSKAALDALKKVVGTADQDQEQGTHLVLYNYPSFSGVFAALLANLYHSRLQLPFLILPFSSVEPLRTEDLKLEGLQSCYLLDFIGPKDFAVDLSQFIPRVIAFDHRKSTLARVSQLQHIPENLKLHIDTEKSSSCAVYDHFSKKLPQTMSTSEDCVSLLNHEDKVRVESLLRYIQDADLRHWNLPDIKAFNLGLREERSKINCITNPYVFEQLLNIDSTDVIAKGNSYICSRQEAAKNLLGKAFKIQLGRGLYGECLGIRADGNSYLSHEIGVELSKKSASAGLRPIGAVVFMQKGNLKMCLRSTDSTTDTSEVAKAYGGGGNFGSSSFIIRMDEYNHWTCANSS